MEMLCLGSAAIAFGPRFMHIGTPAASRVKRVAMGLKQMFNRSKR